MALPSVRSAVDGDESGKVFGKLGLLLLAFQIFAVALTFAIPDRSYSNSALLRGLADAITAVFGSIQEFAGVSAFPGTTRVVLAVLWLCVPPLALVQWLVPGFIHWRPEVHAKARYAVWVLPFLALWFCALPAFFHLAPDDLRGGSSVDLLIRGVTTSRLVFAFVAATYCFTCAWLLALLPRALRFLLSSPATPGESS